MAQSNPPTDKAKKKASKKKKGSAPWESDGEEEPDMPAYPPGIMKVIVAPFHTVLTPTLNATCILAGHHVLWRKTDR